jgi:hypothetical protein
MATGLATIIVTLASSSAIAHHSTQASYEMDRVVNLSGVVKRFRMSNPHSQLYFDVTGADGKTTTWVAELASPGNWRRQGWDENVFKPGDKIQVAIHPAISGAPAGHPETVTLANGVRVDQGGHPLKPGEMPRGGD